MQKPHSDAMTSPPTDSATRTQTMNPQLPEEMQDCTIRFIKCDVGHGRLTATNWVDNGCPWCRIKKLELANEGLGAIAAIAIKQWCEL